MFDPAQHWIKPKPSLFPQACLHIHTSSSYHIFFFQSVGIKFQVLLTSNADNNLHAILENENKKNKMSSMYKSQTCQENRCHVQNWCTEQHSIHLDLPFLVVTSSRYVLNMQLHCFGPALIQQLFFNMSWAIAPRRGMTGSNTECWHHESPPVVMAT